MLHPVILCGGSGTRLWPLSRTLYPKQFMEYDANIPSLFAQTLARVQHLQRQYERSIGAPSIVCHEEHRFFVASIADSMSMPGHRKPQIILEPQARNTAPAIALAALATLEGDKDARLLILPSDHSLQPEHLLIDVVEHTKKAVEDGYLVTLGITPTSPKTGYGYIKYGGVLNDCEDAHNKTLHHVHHVENFIEKPQQDIAASLISSGHCLWNSGMFIFRADAYLAELEKYMPDMLDICRHAWTQRIQDRDFIRPDTASFAACPSQSIDYAVMERTTKAAVLPLNALWTDMGTWDAFYDVDARQTDAQGNVVKGDVIAHKTRNSYIHADNRLVATLGVEDVVVVETADAVLVTTKQSCQDVKTLVSAMQAQGRKEAIWHHRVFRPWGYYETLALSERFQVKRIVVNPGEALSLQMHYHRAEHWVVVKGTAEITQGDNTFFLTENQSTYIAPTQKHRLKNPSIVPLTLIEIQSGAYLGEDDIVRFDDESAKART